MRKRVVYGEANYEALVRKHGYFVDKTRYIETLEMVENPVFLRPQRFEIPVVPDIRMLL